MTHPGALTLRDARPGDEALLIQFIHELADYEKLSHEVRITNDQLHAALFGPHPRAHALLAERDGAPVGYAMWYYCFSSFAGRSSLYVEDVYVEPAQRGKGIGRAIFRHLARLAADDTCGRMEWVVLDWNTPSIAFYQGLGATPVRGWTTYGLSGNALAALAA